MNVGSRTQQIDLAREPSFTLGALAVCPATREVIAGADRETIEPRVMQVLVALARRRGEVVSRDELILTCWNGRVVSDDAINRCIAGVRRLATAYGGFGLETIPRVGYRLLENTPEPPQTAASETQPDGTAATYVWTDLLFRVAQRPRLVAASFAAAVLLIVAAVGVVDWLRPVPDKVLQVRAPVQFSIAVLPFTPLSRDRDLERLADTVVSRAANLLSRAGCDVVSPATSLQYRGAAKTGAIKALQVNFLIDGELQRERDRILAAVRLIDGSNGATVLSDTFEWPTADMAAVPEYVGTEVANYGWIITSGFPPQARWDPHVMADGLKVLRLLTNRYDTNRSNTLNANDLARQLADSAPDDAFAQMLHALAAARLVADLPPELKPRLVAEARHAAEAAIRLDPLYGDPYTVLSAMTPAFDWAERERQLRRGLGVRSQSPNAYINLVELYQNAGRFRDAATMAESAYARDPYLDDVNVKLINTRIWLGKPAAAQPLLERGRKLHPRSEWFLAKMFEIGAFYGDPAAAEALLKDPEAASLLQPEAGSRVYSAIAAALRYRRPADVKAAVDECTGLTGRPLEIRRTCLQAFAALGRLDDAFRLADLLYPDQRGATAAEVERRWLAANPFATAYLLAPATAPLRADPRFRAVVERVGLLQYWKASGRAPDFCAVEKAPVCVLVKPS